MEKVREEVDRATNRYGAKVQEVAKRAAELDDANRDFNIANSEWKSAKGLFDEANRAVSHSTDDLNSAKKAFALAESRRNDLKKHIEHLTFISTRPHRP
jgi:chromosome segregation ATPase